MLLNQLTTYKNILLSVKLTWLVCQLSINQNNGYTFYWNQAILVARVRRITK